MWGICVCLEAGFLQVLLEIGFTGHEAHGAVNDIDMFGYVFSEGQV